MRNVEREKVPIQWTRLVEIQGRYARFTRCGRAGCIAGFSYVNRTPGHLEIGVPGGVACGGEPGPADTRALAVNGLPEFGEYLFGLVALTDSDTGVARTQRAPNLRVAVTEALVDAAGFGALRSTPEGTMP